jgi:pentatricopeptide repeat protein
LDQAIDVLEVMVSKKCSPDIVTYNTLLNAISKRGMIEEALVIFQSIRENGCQVVLITYNTLIDALAKKGEVIKAMALFDEMINGGISPDNVTYGSLMSFSKKNMAKEALELLNQMLSLGFEVKTTTFESEAAEILRVMVSRNSNLRSAFYLSIVSRVAMSGQLKEAQILHRQLVECKVLKEDSQFILSS